MDTFIRELTVDQMAEGRGKEIAKLIGIENLYKLSLIYGGSDVYIPKPEKITQSVRNAKIRDEANKYNRSEIAKKHGLSKQRIWQLHKGGFTEQQATVTELGCTVKNETSEKDS